MRLVAIVLCAGCGLADSGTQGVTDQARCVTRSPAGTVCHEYEYDQPATRNALAAACGGEFSEAGCSTDDALGACRGTGPAPLVASYIYRDYLDVAGFVADCAAHGGQWDGQ